MDIHRCRFVPYPPSPINVLSFSHPLTRTKLQSSLCRLAVGRANGDIEIWNPCQGTWLQETVIHGGQDRSIDGLVWVTEPDEDISNPEAPGEKTVIPGRSRLFSIGYTSAVTEWDLEKGRPLRTASGQHGDIWCLAAQPAATPKPSKGKGGASANFGSNDGVTKLVAGTIDGALAIYTIADSELRFQRLLVKSPARKTQMVSIAFQSRDVVVVGCSDSTLRAYDMRHGTLLRKMTLGSDLAGGSKEIIVWSVKCLPSGEIISGDSTGHVTIWDGKTYTQVQRIQSHRQDVLSLAASADGSSIFSGGMDRRTVLYKRVAGTAGRWGKVWGRKYHDHDVKTMATFESAKMSVVLSGGPDASPVVLPLKEHGRENHRTLANLPQEPPLQSAAKARLIISWWDREVNIWKLRQTFDGLYGEDGNVAEDLNKNRKLLKTILIKGESSISSATISPDGRVLAVATCTDVKAFHLQHSDAFRPSDVRLAPVQVPKTLATTGAKKVQISPDGQWLVVVQESNKVIFTKITYNDAGPSFSKPQPVTRIKRKIPKHLRIGGLGAYERTISHVAFAHDSKMFATVDLAGYIDTWVLSESQDAASNDDDDMSSSSDTSDSEEEDSDAVAKETGNKWQHTPAATVLPKLPATPVVLSFSPSVPSVPNADGTIPVDYTLLVVTTQWHINTFHPLEGALTPWSRRNPVARLPTTIRDTCDPAKGVLWQNSRIWLYGVSFLFMLDLSQDFSDTSSAAGANGSALAKAGHKRKRRGPHTGAGGSMAVGSIVPSQIDRYVSAEGKRESDVENTAPSSRSEGSDTDMLDAELGDDDDDDENFDNEQGDESEGGELVAVRNRDAQADGAADGAESGRRKWWATFKYRPVFGIVTLDGQDEEKPEVGAVASIGQGDSPLEAVLVERPIWDVDLPERYFGVNEVER